MSILIVEDSDDICLIMNRHLTKIGYKNILLAASAEEAFDIIGLDKGDSGINKDVELILMDIGLPGLDGIGACKKIKSNHWYNDVPIIMVTGDTSVISLENAFKAGAIDYITKPVKMIELRARVDSALKLKNEMDRRKAREIELEALTRQLKEANRILTNLSYIDGLTGVANRRYFDDYSEQEWKKAFRGHNFISVVLVDIDFFKQLNDTEGHLYGDDCLRRVAGALSDALRRPGDFIARYGGEEFVSVLPDTTLDGAALIGETMRTNVNSLNLCFAQSKTVTVSIGIAGMIPDKSRTLQWLISEADRALYTAKKSGKNQVKVF
ncbi:GGDEF domain-containing response regulator [Candidatus Magnetominusculus xianensis]|uniref:diguanylate cyclase n=1 Tax=Candidatus Magnetominusculus xianensis TaxID=1748249 RepID=A0ABR5SBH4_9BACT|nr:diguanylate cyclase [Candidatus Magnetominusculus xianensis]KWT76802.1 diguanylate cyclase response regulator [Candidatus Magnetominusculus xianensis]MBF0402692.1 diguanylate cyclase [Nitrospirota bacterium]